MKVRVRVGCVGEGVSERLCVGWCAGIVEFTIRGLHKGDGRNGWIRGGGIQRKVEKQTLDIQQ